MSFAESVQTHKRTQNVSGNHLTSFMKETSKGELQIWGQAVWKQKELQLLF